MSNELDFTAAVLRIVRELGLEADINPDTHISNYKESHECVRCATGINVKAFKYGNVDKIQVEVRFRLPEEGPLAMTYIEHCAAAAALPKNGDGYYCSPRSGKTYVYSPWGDHYFIVEARDYTPGELDSAVENVILLAREFVQHLGELASFRMWTQDDPEVIREAERIIEGADLYESDCDRETRSHWLRDRNSFFRGWFNPWNDNGRGTFDILWPSSVDRAAIGIRGSFEYAVSSRLLVDPRFIAKARKACRIRKETRTYTY